MSFLRQGEKPTAEEIIKELFYVGGKSLRPGVEEAGKLHLVPQQHPKSKQSPAGVTSIEAAAEEA